MQRNLHAWSIRDLAGKKRCEFECLTRIENGYPDWDLLFRALANQISLKKIVHMKKKHLRLN